MESRTQVAQYAATMTKELCRMCRKVELDDLAYLLEVAATDYVQAAVAIGNPAWRVALPMPCSNAFSVNAAPNCSTSPPPRRSFRS